MERSEPKSPMLSDEELEQISFEYNKIRIARAMSVIAARAKRYWDDSALCSALDPESFDTTILTSTAIRRAKEVCNKCRVVDQCLVAGMNQGENTMIWGGMTPNELRDARKGANRSKRRAQNVGGSQ